MKFDAVIFDIDNVLIDTRPSYTDCIRQTVEDYLTLIVRFQSSRTPLLSRKDIEQFKSLGGFNDDWDTSYGLLLYFLSLNPKRRTINELRKKKQIAKLLKSVKTKPLGVKGAEKLFGKHPVVLFDTIIEMFQKLYLGEYVWNEKPIIPAKSLSRLKKKGLRLGIFTGRNGEEARFVLRRFQLDRFFNLMITQDETPKNLKKPNPYGLTRLASHFGQDLKYLYVGDLPDDMLAATRAQKKMKVEACGFVGASGTPTEMKRSLKKAGAKYICTKPSELLKLVLK